MPEETHWLNSRLWARLSVPRDASGLSFGRVARGLVRRVLGHIHFCLLSLHNYLARRPLTDPDSPVIVSLTTHGKRIGAVYAAVESIGLGDERPQRIILWVDQKLLEAGLPPSLQRLGRRGLEIVGTQDYGPHTKYWPFVSTSVPGTGPLVIADDDTMYPRYWLSLLTLSYRCHPEDIHCYRARTVRFAGTRLAPWSDWGWCSSPSASILNLATGVSGVLYPAHVLDALRVAGKEFEARATINDDIWLHSVAVRSGTKTRQLGSSPIHFAIVPGSQRKTLMSLNIGQNRNDDQVATTYTQCEIEMLLEADWRLL